MKLSNIVLSTFLALSLNTVANAAEHVETKNAQKDCPTEAVTSAYISYKTASQNTGLGALYEDYTNKIKALPATGHFNNFKIVSQNFRTDPTYRSVADKQISIDFTVQFDLNYQAVTDLTSLKASDVSINTFQQKRCK